MDAEGENNKTSLDSDVRSKLATCEERIAQLERQLAIHRELRDSLLNQLHQETSPPASSGLPNEIVLQIFEAIVAVDSPGMCSILSVSRKWNQLAMSQQSLWARLSFQVPATNTIMYLLRSTRYARQVLLRSRELLIDVSVDFRGITDLETVTFSEAASGFLPKEIITSSWWNTWHTHSSAGRRDTCTFAEITQSIFFKFTQSHSHQASRRLRTFTFKTSSDLDHSPGHTRYDFSKITFFHDNTPALERVDLLDYNARYMSYIPKFKHLLIHSNLFPRRTHRGYDKSCSEALRTLHIRVDYDFPDLRDAKNLLVVSVDTTDRLDPQMVDSIRLNSLERLSLRGPCANAILHLLRAPRLHTLRLIGKQAIESASKLVKDLRVTDLHILAADSGGSFIRAFFTALIVERVIFGGIFVMPWHLAVVKKALLLESGTTAGPMFHTLEWNVSDANSEGLEELLWRSHEDDFHYRAHHIA